MFLSQCRVVPLFICPLGKFMSLSSERRRQWTVTLCKIKSEFLLLVDFVRNLATTASSCRHLLLNLRTFVAQRIETGSNWPSGYFALGTNVLFALAACDGADCIQSWIVFASALGWVRFVTATVWIHCHCGTWVQFSPGCVENWIVAFQGRTRKERASVRFLIKTDHVAQICICICLLACLSATARILNYISMFILLHDYQVYTV